MARKIRAGFAVAFLALTLIVGFGASTASAAQPSWCGWRPANHSDQWGRMSGPAPIRSGQGTQCNIIGNANQGDGLNIRCQVKNGAGVIWFYVDDGSQRGWVPADHVFHVFNPQYC